MSNNRIKSTEDYADAFKALANTNRLKIFLRMLDCCNPGTRCSSDKVQKFCVGDLGEDLTVSASTLSHHMKELNRAGLIEMQRRGQHIDCWIETDTVDRLRTFFETKPER